MLPIFKIMLVGIVLVVNRNHTQEITHCNVYIFFTLNHIKYLNVVMFNIIVYLLYLCNITTMYYFIMVTNYLDLKGRTKYVIRTNIYCSYYIKLKLL